MTAIEGIDMRLSVLDDMIATSDASAAGLGALLGVLLS